MEILVLAEDAPDYAPFLGDLDDVTFSDKVAGAPTTAQVLLGQPDLAAEYLERGARPDWVQSTWAGVTPLLPHARAQNFKLTGIKDVFGQAIAEYIFAYLLADVRKTEQSRLAQKAGHWRPFTVGTLAQKHMVIVGAGSIGQRVASMAKTFKMRVSGVSRTGTAQPIYDELTTFPGPNLARADFLVLILPDTPATTDLIDREVLALLPERCMLINVGRGSTVNHEALVLALQSGQLRKAVLDVFPEEPLSLTSPLWRMANAVITPHIAGTSHPGDIAPLFLRNLDNYLTQQPLNHLIDVHQGY